MNDNDEDYSGAIAMTLEMKLTPKVTQTLVMTLQQQQALKILQLARAELDPLIDETLAENPVVERVDENEETEPGESLTVGEEPITDTPPAEIQESDWQKYLDGYEDIPRLPATGGDGEPAEGRLNLVENQPNRPESLEQHLLEQLRLSELTAEEEQIAFLIIGHLDTDGYMQISLADLATNAGIEPEMVEHVLQLIHACDPSGVGARDLQECLLLQLRAQEPEDPAIEDPIVPLATTIVRDHLHALEGRCFEQLAKDLGVPVEVVTRAVRLIATLEPKPGRNFGEDEICYVTPDVYVHKKERIREIILTEDPAQPLSDGEIVQALARDSVHIARRTVVKYRKGLGIPSSTSRSRFSDRPWRKNAKTVL